MWAVVLAYLLLGALPVYVVWQLSNLRRWRSLTKSPYVAGAAAPRIAVIIPFRNEADNLPVLLASLKGQSYRNYEIILVDDYSTDGGDVTAGEAFGRRRAGAGWGRETEVSLRIIHLADFVAEDAVVAHKKAALALGIRQTSAEIILTTDADCHLPPDLLARVSAAISPETQVVLGPVLNAPLSDFCHHFQALDLAAYQFLTATSLAAGTPLLANGACFAFRRSSFTAVNGYAGVDHLPSGDDVLLLHKFRAALPASAFGWLSGTAAVTTRPVDGWLALWRQRLRWASKAGSYQAPELDRAQALAFGVNLALLALLFLTWHPRAVAPCVAGWLLKLVIDYRCLHAVLTYYGRQHDLRWYQPTAFLYPFFLVGIGSAALAGLRPRWKGRITSA